VRWPARVEVVRRRPVVVLDASHNPASASALVETIDESFSPSRRTLVFAGTKEKDTAGMLAVLLPRFERVVFTRYLNNPRHVPAEELLAIARDQRATNCRIAPDPAAAWKIVISECQPDDLICVTGSFFIAAEMRDEIEKS
jgi:dihydrofolate synthase/folylpolyglutamate synthase